jgi:hypothetical protein
MHLPQADSLLSGFLISAAAAKSSALCSFALPFRFTKSVTLPVLTLTLEPHPAKADTCSLLRKRRGSTTSLSQARAVVCPTPGTVISNSTSLRPGTALPPVGHSLERTNASAARSASVTAAICLSRSAISEAITGLMCS